MRLLVDESTGRKLCELLKSAGHDAVYVGDALPGSTDEEVLAAAEREKRVLITDDKGFGELVFRLNRPTSGVVLLRTSGTDAQKRFESIIRTLAAVRTEGNFTTVTEGRVKTRAPP